MEMFRGLICQESFHVDPRGYPVSIGVISISVLDNAQGYTDKTISN